MEGGPLDRLPGWARELLEQAPVAHLGLLDDRDRPRVLPVTFALAGGELHTAIDHKPKRAAEPARVRYLRRRAEAALTADHYEDDWTRLAWVQALGRVEVVEAAPPAALAALRRKYGPYRERPPEGPFLRLVVERTLCWRAEAPGAP